MNEEELVVSLAEFSEKVRKEVRGLTSRITWFVFGVDADYVIGGTEGEELEHGVRRFPKEKTDWETYVLLYGAGAIQGHATGQPERRGSGWTGKLEEKKDVQFIHQLLASNCSSLKVACNLRYPALSERVALMNEEPHRTAAILYFQEYLRSIYRSVAGADAEVLLKHIAELPGDAEPESLLTRWKEVEAKLKAEKRPAIYEVIDGRFHVFEKIGKRKRLINGWLFGIEGEEAGEEEESDGEIDSDYDRRIEGAAFPVRMALLVEEALRILGPQGEELISLAAEYKAGRLAKVLSTVQRLSDLAQSNMLEEHQKPVAKALVEHMEKISTLVSRNARILSTLGIEPDLIRERHLDAQKLKRKL